MLNLTRKNGEKVYLHPAEDILDKKVSELFKDGNIELTILDAKNNHVVIGIDAPTELSISRDNIKKKAPPKSESRRKFWQIKNIQNELIFMLVLFVSSVLTMTVKYTEYWGMIGALVVMLAGSTYFSVNFFKGDQRFERIYFYICIIPFCNGQEKL